MRYLSLHACDLVHQVFAPLQRGLAAEAAAQEFLVVPGKGTPRWLLPAQHHRIDQVLASWSPYRPTSRLKWAAIRAAHRAGCLAVLPDVGRVNTPFADDIDWHSVGWRGNSTPVPVVYVGTPAVSRKAVIHLVNPESGICEAIVKVPLTEAARAAILWEADVLEILADEGFTGAPRLLYSDSEGGVATQTALNGKAGSRKFDAAYGELLRSLVLDGERTTIAGHASEWREKLLRNVESETDPRIMTAVWSELHDVDPIPACWIHGDFAPWNIRRLPNGTVVLLDWECAQRGGLPLQDAFHFLHIQDYLFGARPSAHSHARTGLCKVYGNLVRAVPQTRDRVPHPVLLAAASPGRRRTCGILAAYAPSCAARKAAASRPGDRLSSRRTTGTGAGRHVLILPSAPGGPVCGSCRAVEHGRNPVLRSERAREASRE